MQHLGAPRKIIVLFAAVLFAVGCGSSGEATQVGESETDAVDVASSDNAESNETSDEDAGEDDSEPVVPEPEPEDSAEPAVEETASVLDATQLQIEGPLVEIDSTWNQIERHQFVYGVDADDRLNLRSGPMHSAELVGSLAPAATGIRIFDVVTFTGESRWSPVALDGGAAWVNLAYLRPHSSFEEIEFRGDQDQPVLQIVNSTVEALGSTSYLATLVGPAGLTISIDSYIDEQDQVLSAAELATNDPQAVLWGHLDGSGDPVERSLDEQLQAMLGVTAVTSTDIISVNESVGSGNMFDNLAEVFPAATVIEYHFLGTDYYGGLDWSSLRLAFEEGDEGEFYLVALALAQWTT